VPDFHPDSRPFTRGTLALWCRNIRLSLSLSLSLSLTVIAAVIGMGALEAARTPTVSLAAAPGVNVFPIPGGRVASPQTQITFRGVPAGSIASVTVTGSKSGAHSGKVLGDSDGNGGSFVPDHAFTAGETVTVATALNIVGGRNGRYSFRVAIPTNPLPILHWPSVRRSAGDVQFYHSRKDLSPVSISVTQRGATGDGDFFLAPQSGPVQDGPMILDPNGNLIWFDRMRGNTSVASFSVQRYQGQPVLAWWQGTLVAGVGASGQDVIFDSSYKQVATVKAGNGLNTDLHDLEITPENTALITADYPVYWDATSIKHGNRRQIVLDSVVQEIDIKTGLVLFQWDALDHIPLPDTYQTLPSSLGSPFDAYHLNSVDRDHDGNLIVSSRETWAAYKINHQTGAIMWTLGGKHSSFKLAPGTYWAYQHDVRSRSTNDSVFTFFDNEGPPRVRSQSRAIRVALDWKHMTARSITDEKHSPALASNYEGNLQQLGDGDFVGWGEQPYFTQFDRNGHTVFDAHMNNSTPSYRVYRFHWNATPWTPPTAIASTSKGKSYVFMSWNGATGIAGWRVWSGASPTSLHYVMSVSKNAFESKAVIPAAKYIEVQAVDAHHNAIRSSSVVAAS
jgi:arylsulfotransferase ASST